MQLAKSITADMLLSSATIDAVHEARIQRLMFGPVLQAKYGGREADVAYDGLVETTPDTIITRDTWRWAWTIVASRSFSFTYVGGALLKSKVAAAAVHQDERGGGGGRILSPKKWNGFLNATVQ